MVGRRNKSWRRHYKVPEILTVTTDSLRNTDLERAEDRKPPNDLEKGLPLPKLFPGTPNLGDGCRSYANGSDLHERMYLLCFSFLSDAKSLPIGTTAQITSLPPSSSCVFQEGKPSSRSTS